MGLQRGGRALLSLDAGHVGELVAELAPLVEGCTLEAAVAALPRDLVLVLVEPADGSGPPPRLRLRLSADPDGPRLHLQVARQPRPSGPLGPFWKEVEAELAGARLKQLVQVARDRVVQAVFDRTPSGEPRSLVLELFGRRANLVLCGRGERVLALLVPPAPDARQARLLLGEPWCPAPGTPREPPPGARLRADLGPAPEALGELRPDPRAPLSWVVESRLGAAVREAARARDAKDLRARLERRLQRARALVAGLERRADASREAARVRLDGELLKLNLARLQRGLASIELEDVFTDGAARRLALDPRRSPHENVQAYFERYKKLVRAEASVAQELELARAKAGALADLCARLDAPAAEPAEVEARAREEGLLGERQVADERKRKPPPPRKPYRSFIALRGSEIRVGRSARDNDELTLRHARGNDLWLHTADAPGSHVVLRLERGATPDEEELLDAAHLAVHFSPLREAGRANVHLARRKEVHKPRGAKPGLVTLSGGRVLSVRMQPQRLQRLLGRAERSAAAADDPGP